MLRSGVGVINQIGFETTPGTPVAANRFLPTINFNFKPVVGAKKFRANGSRTNTSTVQHKRMTNGDFDGILDYNSFTYLCEGLFNTATPLTVITAAAFQRIYYAGVRTADSTRKTFTIEDGDATAIDRYSFAQLLSLAIEAGQEDFTVKGNLAARYPNFNQTITPGPTEIAERAVERSDVNVYIDTSFANLGTTQVTEAFAESFNMGDKYKPVFVHNRTAGEFHDVVELPYEATYGFETAYNAQARALAATITANAKRWLRWEAQGNLLGNNGSADIYEMIRIDMAGRFEDPEIMRNGDEPYGIKFNFGLEPDVAGLGSHLKITIMNSLATL